jgi:predicted transcriptional regulator of viral defense system
MVHFPPSDREDLVALWLWSGREGVFSHETALAIHQLSDTMPANIHMTFPLSWGERRMRYPQSVVPSFSAVSQADRSWVGPVPATSPLRTIKDCRAAHVEPDLVDQAIAEAVERGLFRAEVFEHG